MSPADTIWVALGGALGSIARYWLAIGVAVLTGPYFPWGTLLINIIGSFLIGGYGVWSGAGAHTSRLFIMVGFCGGFTTFSSFSLQTLELLEAGEVLRAAGYISGSVALCLAGVWAGVTFGRP